LTIPAAVYTHRTLSIAFFLLLTGCRRQDAIPIEKAVKSGAELNSVVYTGDANSAPQLISGFYNIEEFSWRWTARRFSVVLRPPGGVSGSDANLSVELTIPEAEMAKIGSLALNAAIGSTFFAPETYIKPGSYTYAREIPASLLNKAEVRIDFRLDKAMEPGGSDIRELGVIVKSIGLESR
jgi:hypothetical protein